MRGLSAHPLQSRGHLPPSRLDSPTWCSLDIGTSVCPVGRQGRRHSPFSPLGFQPPHQIGETLRRGEGAELRPFAWLPLSPGVPHVPCLLCSPRLIRLLGTWPPGHSPGGSRADAYLFLGGAALHPPGPCSSPSPDPSPRVRSAGGHLSGHKGPSHVGGSGPSQEPCTLFPPDGHWEKRASPSLRMDSHTGPRQGRPGEGTHCPHALGVHTALSGVLVAPLERLARVRRLRLGAEPAAVSVLQGGGSWCGRQPVMAGRPEGGAVGGQRGQRAEEQVWATSGAA